LTSLLTMKATTYSDGKDKIPVPLRGVLPPNGYAGSQDNRTKETHS